MATLYLDRKDIEIRHEGRHLCLYENGGRSGTVPLNLVERVVVRGQATIGTGALNVLANEGVGLVVLSGRQNRSVAALLGRGHGDCRRRIAQYRWYFDADYRLRWARALVRLKLRAQRRMLANAMGRRPDCRKPLFDAQATLDLALDKLGGAELASLRGLEGAGAAAYFAAYQALFPPGLNFTGRNRRPPKDPVNAALSLGYTLLHHEAVFACHAAGLDPYVGFFHDPAHNRESLAADVIEPLRAKVDGWVWRLFAERTLKAEMFHPDGEACLLGKTGRERFYAEYETFVRPLRGLLRRAVGRMANRLLEDGPWS